jgi:hypothetical protein
MVPGINTLFVKRMDDLIFQIVCLIACLHSTCLIQLDDELKAAEQLPYDSLQPEII